MSTTYTISSTDGNSHFIIEAGSIDGNVTGKAGHQTDLLLYGRGTFNWGKGVEQNLIRLTENWASPALNPNAPVNEQVPMTYGSTENKGIVVPLVGQTWFNKSNNRLYTYVQLWDDVAEDYYYEWHVDGEFKYVSLTETADQSMEGKLRIASPNGQPDLYIYSDTPTFGVGSGPIDTNTGLPTDLGASSYITFEANRGTEAAPERVRTAYIAALHKSDNLLRIALGDRDSATSYGDVQNRIDLKADYTEASKNIKYIGTDQISDNIDEKTLTTREWVEDYVDGAVTDVGDATYLRLDDATARIESDGNARYLKLTGGTITGAVNQTVGANTININNGSIQVEASSPTVTLRSLANDAGQPSFNLADSDITKVSFKMIQGNYSGNAGARVLADNVDTLVIEKYNTGFNTTQAMIFYDDYIQTHGDNGHLRTPATIMQGEAGYSALYQLTVGKAYDTFCAINTDVTVKDITANNISMSNGSDSASILVHSQNTATITIDASNNLDTVNPSLIFRARGGQRGILRVIPDTGGNDALALLKMNGGAAPNALKMYDEYSTLEQRLIVGGVGDSPSHGSIILQAKDNSVNGTVHDYNGSTVDSDYNGIVWKKASGGFVASILSDNDQSLVIRVPTNPSVTEINAPLVTLSNDEMLLTQMRVRTTGTESYPPANTRLTQFSNYLAHERTVYELSHRRIQQELMPYKTLLINVLGNPRTAGWYRASSYTSDPTAGDYQGLYGDPIEFDFTDTSHSSFSDATNDPNAPYLCEVHFQMPYAVIVNTGTGVGSAVNAAINLQYECGPNLDLAAVSNVSIGNFTTIRVATMQFTQSSDELIGSLSGIFFVPMAAGDKIHIRSHSAFGHVSSSFDWYERAIIGDTTFTARIV